MPVLYSRKWRVTCRSQVYYPALAFNTVGSDEFRKFAAVGIPGPLWSNKNIIKMNSIYYAILLIGIFSCTSKVDSSVNSNELKDPFEIAVLFVDQTVYPIMLEFDAFAKDLSNANKKLIISKSIVKKQTIELSNKFKNISNKLKEGADKIKKTSVPKESKEFQSQSVLLLQKLSKYHDEIHAGFLSLLKTPSKQMDFEWSKMSLNKKKEKDEWTKTYSAQIKEYYDINKISYIEGEKEEYNPKFSPHDCAIIEDSLTTDLMSINDMQVLGKDFKKDKSGIKNPVAATITDTLIRNYNNFNEINYLKTYYVDKGWSGILMHSYTITQPGFMVCDWLQIGNKLPDHIQVCEEENLVQIFSSSLKLKFEIFLNGDTVEKVTYQNAY